MKNIFRPEKKTITDAKAAMTDNVGEAWGAGKSVSAGLLFWLIDWALLRECKAITSSPKTKTTKKTTNPTTKTLDLMPILTPA